MAADALTSPPRTGPATPSTLQQQLHESNGGRRTRQDSVPDLSNLPDLRSFSRTRRGKVPSRSFGSSLFQSLKRPSRSLSIEPSTQSRGSQRSPLIVFRDLLNLLLSHHVPGPSLYRTRTEYTKRLGSGRTFEVLGATPALLNLEVGLKGSISLPEIDAKTVAVRKAITNVPLVAIKRAYVDEQHAASQVSRASAESLTRAFGHQLVCVEREIENLCHPDLRGHPNIIKILGWGLCLDTLEDVTAPEPRIPLLVLEKADCTLGHLITSKELSCQFGCVQRHERQLSILQDIGNGLEAIHKAELIHGDIKLENILILRHREGLIAKLSDFGLTVAGSGDDPTSIVSTYRGTPRWCPLAGSARYSCQDLYSFDHFAYGLVAWCIFADLCHSPLPSEERAGAESDDLFEASTLIDTCVSQLNRKHTEVPLPLRLCLRACLDDDPVHWRKFPWRSLVGITYWRVKAFEYGLETVPPILVNLGSSLRSRIGSSTFLKKGLTSLLRNYGDITGNAPNRL